jgi:glyoxylase-like metal-dependent hydrolase (beta-lactamase superfamily II)
VDRRFFLRAVVPAASAALVLPQWVAAANRKASSTPLTVSELTDRLFVISGGGGNVTAFNSPEGVLLVDGGSPERSKDVLKLVKERTGSSKIHTLFNTHWHWDQTGSNETLGKAGTRIISHENTRLWLTTDVNSKWQNRVFPPLPKQAQPNKTFYTKESLQFGGEQIEYGYLPQAHTDGDIYVFFRNANVLVASDVVSAGAYPVIDYCTNGWIGGMATATQTLLGVSNPATRVVAGLGPPLGRADLEAENAMLAAMKTRLSKLLAQGMSVEDMLAAAPSRDFDAKWGDPTLFISNAWQGLTQRSRELGVSIV